MSVQSESGRVDYNKSDHAPKGKRMAGEVVHMPMSMEDAMKGAAGQVGNERARKEYLEAGKAGAASDPDFSKVLKGPGN